MKKLSILALFIIFGLNCMAKDNQNSIRQEWLCFPTNRMFSTSSVAQTINTAAKKFNQEKTAKIFANLPNDMRREFILKIIEQSSTIQEALKSIFAFATTDKRHRDILNNDLTFQNIIYPKLSNKSNANIAINGKTQEIDTETLTKIDNLALIALTFPNIEEPKNILFLFISENFPKNKKSSMEVLLYAINNNLLNFAKFLINKDIVDINTSNTIKNNTALHLIADQSNKKEAMELLIAHGADLNKPNSDDNTPLYLAVMSNSNIEIIKLLIEHGADLNKPNAKDNTPLHLVANGNYVFPAEASTKIMELLIAHGADINKPNLYGNTALHLAARCNSDIEIMELLLEHGANINKPNCNGNTPLHLAANRHWTSAEVSATIMELLIAYGADANIPNSDGDTALHLAANNTAFCRTAKNINAIMELLIARGADINRPNANGYTPLHMAADHSKPEFVAQLLIEKNANVNALNKKFHFWRSFFLNANERQRVYTPLHIALKDNNNYKVATYLINYGGADVDITDENGDDAIREAWGNLRIHIWNKHPRRFFTHDTTCAECIEKMKMIKLITQKSSSYNSALFCFFGGIICVNPTVLFSVPFITARATGKWINRIRDCLKSF